jgi:hypothetical protein
MFAKFLAIAAISIAAPTPQDIAINGIDSEFIDSIVSFFITEGTSLYDDFILFQSIQPKNQSMNFIGYTTGVKNYREFQCVNQTYALIDAKASLDFIVKHSLDSSMNPVFAAPDKSNVTGLSAKTFASPQGELNWLVISKTSTNGKEGIFKNVKTIIRSLTNGGIAPAYCNATSPQKIQVPFSALYTFYV